MKYAPKIVTITEQDVREWIRIFEKRNPEFVNLVPGLCVWSYAHQDWEGWAAASLDIKFSKPIYVGDTVTFEGEIVRKNNCYCHRVLTASVNGEVKQKAILKCMPLN